MVHFASSEFVSQNELVQWQLAMTHKSIFLFTFSLFETRKTYIAPNVSVYDVTMSKWTCIVQLRGANMYVWAKVDCQGVASLASRIFLWLIGFSHHISAIKEPYHFQTYWLADDTLMVFFNFSQLPDPVMSILAWKWQWIWYQKK